MIKIRENNCVFNFPDYNRISETIWLMVVKSVSNGSPLLWAYGTQHHHGGDIWRNETMARQNIWWEEWSPIVSRTHPMTQWPCVGLHTLKIAAPSGSVVLGSSLWRKYQFYPSFISRAVSVFTQCSKTILLFLTWTLIHKHDNGQVPSGQRTLYKILVHLQRFMFGICHKK